MKLSSLLCAMLLALCLAYKSYDNSEPLSPLPIEFSGNVMFMNYRILIGSTLNSDSKKRIEGIISDVFNEINTIYNKWNPNSELSKLNRLKSGEHAILSKELARFLLRTQYIVELSHGRFDPTIEPIQQLWKETLSKGERPTTQEIKLLSPAIGWNKIHFDETTFYKDHDDTALDLGGIAKGLAVDMILERLEQDGHVNLFVEWGGEIRVSGSHPDNRPWNIFISRFGNTQPEQAIAHLSLFNEAIATSGDYLQNWTIYEVNHKKVTTYFHIIDPHTHQPLVATPKSIASASIIAPNCMLADALATTAMLFESKTEATEWLSEVQKQIPGLKFYLFTRENMILDCEGKNEIRI